MCWCGASENNLPLVSFVWDGIAWRATPLSVITTELLLVNSTKPKSLHNCVDINFKISRFSSSWDKHRPTVFLIHQQEPPHKLSKNFRAKTEWRSQPNDILLTLYQKYLPQPSDILIAIYRSQTYRGFRSQKSYLFDFSLSHCTDKHHYTNSQKIFVRMGVLGCGCLKAPP